MKRPLIRRLAGAAAVLLLSALAAPRPLAAGEPDRAEPDLLFGNCETSFNEGSEVFLSNMLIYTQDNMDAFFADYDSPKRPLPAYAILAGMERAIAKRFDFEASITLPVKEQTVKSADGTETSYFFPKLLSLGAGWNAFGVKVPRTSCVEHQVMAGVNMPLSHRFGVRFDPYVLLRLRVTHDPKAGVNVGVGYSGNFRDGALFFPFGFSYRI